MKKKEYEKAVKYIEEYYSDFEKLKNRFNKDSSETQEEFEDRVRRVSKMNMELDLKRLKETGKLPATALYGFNSENKTKKYKAPSKAKIKVFKIVKRASIPLIAVLSLFTFYEGAGKAGAAYSYYSNSPETRTDIKNDGYRPNISIKPGYYNEHPLKVCIDESFNEIFKKGVQLGVDRIDNVAEGITFETYIGKAHWSNKNADINIVRVQHEPDDREDFKNVAAFVPGNLQGEDEKIKNVIYVYDDVFFYDGISATVAHEIMHVLGIDHSDNIFSIMYPYANNFFMKAQDIKNINDRYPAYETEAYLQKVAEAKSIDNTETNNLIDNLETFNQEALSDAIYEHCCTHNEHFAKCSANKNAISNIVSNVILTFMMLLAAKKLIVKNNKLIANPQFSKAKNNEDEKEM